MIHVAIKTLESTKKNTLSIYSGNDILKFGVFNRVSNYHSFRIEKYIVFYGAIL